MTDFQVKNTYFHLYVLILYHVIINLEVRMNLIIYTTNFLTILSYHVSCALVFITDNFLKFNVLTIIRWSLVVTKYYYNLKIFVKFVKFPFQTLLVNEYDLKIFLNIDLLKAYI